MGTRRACDRAYAPPGENKRCRFFAQSAGYRTKRRPCARAVPRAARSQGISPPVGAGLGAVGRACYA